MTAQVAPSALFKGWDNNGNPLASGKLFTYIAGTTTPQATYTDSTLVTPNTNPVILNSRGEAQVWLDPTKSYKFLLQDQNGVQIPGWPVDNINNFASLPTNYITDAMLATTSQIYAIDQTYNRTAAEIAAGVTPTNYGYPPGDVRRYGAKGDGITDDSAAFAASALVCGTHTMMIPFAIPFSTPTYKVTTPFALPANATMTGEGMPQITASNNGSHICSATGVGGLITIEGIRFLGTSGSAAPSSGFGGFSANNTGLVTISNCNKVRIRDCEASTFFNGITVQGCTRVWIEDSVVDTYTSFGICVSQSTRFKVDGNDISNCIQSGGVVAYGIQCTGNQAGGLPSQFNSISFNRIKDVPSWNAIGTHDIDGVRIVGNDCRNVRHGIDVGHLVSTNVVQNITIANNYVEGPTTDTWGGAAAEIGAILVAGFDATHRVLGATITGNLIRGFFTVVGMVGTANSACISVSNADDVNISGNVITGIATAGIAANGGIWATGTVNRLTISGNSIQGSSITRGAIRLNALTSDSVSIVGNTGNQTTTANNHVSITSSTIAALNVGANPSNSTAAYSESGTTTSSTSNQMLAGSGNAATAVTNNSTIPTAFGLVRCTVAASTTGNILAVGTSSGQEVVIINENGSNTITMAAAGTSNVADGVSCVISNNTHKRFVWDAATSLWYHS